MSKEEKKDGNFPIFNDPDKRYSTFNLKYTHEIFDRLSGLVEFNTALNEQLIRDTIAECVLRRRALNQWTNSPSDVPGCGRTTRILKKFLRHIHMTFYSNQRKEKKWTRRDSYGIDSLSKIQLPLTPQRNPDFSKLSIIQTNTNLHPFSLPPCNFIPESSNILLLLGRLEESQFSCSHYEKFLN